MAQKKTPVQIRQSDGTIKTGYIGADNLSYYDDNTRVSAQTGASSVLKGEKEFKVPGSGMAQKKTPVQIRQSDGTIKTGYIGADNLSYYDDNTRVSNQTGASAVLKGSTEFKVPGTGQAPAYGSNIANFNPNDPKQKELADLGQLWWQAKTKEERDAIAKQGQGLRTSLGEGKTQFNPLTGTTTFVGETGAGSGGGSGAGSGAGSGGGSGAGSGGKGGSFAWDAYNDADGQARNLAQSKVDRYMSESKDSITNFLERLKSTREQSLRGAETAAEQQRQALQGRGFLQSRAAQQAMTGRGLTGSGLAADAQTRLGLQGQQELSQLYSDLANKRFSIDEQYRLTEEEKLRELQTLEANKSNLTEEEYQNALDRIYNRTNQRLSALFQEASLTGQYGGQRTLAGQQFDRSVFESDRAYTYQQARDAIADENWKKQFDENVRQFGLGYAVQEAQLTGKFQGQDTLAGRQLGMQEQQLMADLTGTYIDKNGNVQKTTQQQQQDLANLWNVATQTGVIGKELAAMYGLPENTPTVAGKQLAMQQTQLMADLTGTYVDENGKVQKTTQQQQQDLANLWKLADETGQISLALANFYGISPNTSTLAAKQLAANQTNQGVQTSLDIWRATGKAPKGLEAYGVQEGTAFYTPEQKTAVGNSYAQQAASGELKPQDFIKNIISLHGTPNLISGDPNTPLAKPPVYGDPKMPTDTDARYQIWGLIEDSGYNDADLAQIYSSLGISAEEQKKFFERWQNDYNKRATTTNTTNTTGGTGTSPFQLPWQQIR